MLALVLWSGCKSTGKLDLCRLSVSREEGTECQSRPLGEAMKCARATLGGTGGPYSSTSPIWKDEVCLYSAWETMLPAE